MRASPSWPEQVLFGAIRGGRVGACVKRQVVIGSYIADFAVPSRKLVIEVDGPHHALQRSADARRDRALRRLGWRVLRLDAELVVKQMPEAVRRVHEALDG